MNMNNRETRIQTSKNFNEINWSFYDVWTKNYKQLLKNRNCKASSRMERNVYKSIISKCYINIRYNIRV